jgi:hypothetical protein
MTTPPRCSVCANPLLEAISAALEAGDSLRDIAGRFGTSRSALARHKAHAPCQASGDQLEEALALLERTPPSRGREHLRALEAARAALELELKDFRRARAATKTPTAAQRRQLRKNLRDAWAAFERVREGGTETALRALQGVREAERAYRQATAAQEQQPGTVVLQTAEGKPGGGLLPS